MDNRRLELEQVSTELGGLPLSINEIIILEDLGYMVDLLTGEVSQPTDRISLTPPGEAYAIILACGFPDEHD